MLGWSDLTVSGSPERRGKNPVPNCSGAVSGGTVFRRFVEKLFEKTWRSLGGFTQKFASWFLYVLVKGGFSNML